MTSEMYTNNDVVLVEYKLTDDSAIPVEDIPTESIPDQDEPQSNKAVVPALQPTPENSTEATIQASTDRIDTKETIADNTNDDSDNEENNKTTNGFSGVIHDLKPWSGLADDDDYKAFINDLARSLENATGKTVDIVETGAGTTCLFFTRIDGSTGAIDIDYKVAAGWTSIDGRAMPIDPTDETVIRILAGYDDWLRDTSSLT